MSVVANRVTKLFTRNECHSIEDTCLRIVSLCRSSPESMEQGFCVHSPIIKMGLHGNLYLCNNLLSLYGKCYGAGTARHLFDEMPHRDVVSWTGLVSAYSRDGKYGEALDVFGSMMVSGESPNEFTLSSVLGSCSDGGDFDEGSRVHGFVIKLGFGSNKFLLSSLMDLYAKSGFTEDAHKLFGDMDGGGDTISWTTMISSLVQAQKWRPALQHYIEMVRARVVPNEFTFAKLLEASRHVDSSHGKLLHAGLTVLGIRLSLVLKTALVEMYSNCRRFEDAVKVLHRTPEHDVLLWTALVSGFTDNLRVKEAVSALHEMESFGVSPNSFTYSNVLKACSEISSLELGKQIHNLVVVAGLEDDVCVGNALVDMYMTCSDDVDDGLRAFEEINSPNIVSWTCLISGLAQHGFERESFEYFSQMRSLGVEPNSFTVSTVLRSCSAIKSWTQTSKLHGYVIKADLDSDVAVGNALVDAYGAVGAVNDSWRVLKTMKQRDVITYTSFAARANKSGRPETALGVINCMRDDCVGMDGFSLASFLSASAELASMETGKQLHCRSIKSGFVGFASVANGLVDLYWKCGNANDGHRAFGEISKPDIVSWNGLISGLASNGHISKALSAFDDMRLSGFKPDSVTFLSLLFACSHGDLVDLGVEFFHSMRNVYDITPNIDHYICLVDLLGRAGQLENAMDVIGSIPFNPDPLIYKTLLSACRLHRNIPIGEDMARRGIKLDPNDTAFYSLLANLYDDCGRAELATKTRELMRDKGLKKNIGQSWIELRDQVHIFNAGDRSHPRISEIYRKIASLKDELKRRGLSSSGTEVLAYHSEKLAVVFGLLNSPSNAPIRVGKNMRICSECHDFIRLVTCVVDRDIIVRDGNRVHNFKNGKCSCGGC